MELIIETRRRLLAVELVVKSLFAALQSLLLLSRSWPDGAYFFVYAAVQWPRQSILGRKLKF